MTLGPVAMSKSAFLKKDGVRTPTALLGFKSMKQSTLDDDNTDDIRDVTCPTCGRDDFKNQRGLRQHHARTHNESLRFTAVECEFCGSEYNVEKEKTESSRFCSRECQHDAMETDLHPNLTRKEVSCANCGGSVTTTRKQREDFNAHYCNSDCMYEHRTGEDHHNYNSVKIECNECGEVLERNKSHVGELGAFCSHDCYASYLSREWTGRNSPNWRGGVSTVGVVRTLLGEDSWNKTAERARKRAGRECKICGEKPTSKKLDVHHIVPVVAGGTNEMWNLLVLCDSCHAVAEAHTRDLPGMEAILK